MHLIWLDFGPEAARAFLDHSQHIVTNWLVGRGYTIGIGDTIADGATMDKINETISGHLTPSSFCV